MIVTSIFNAPCGQLILGATEDGLCLCDWNIEERRKTVDPRLCREFNTTMAVGENQIIKEACQQLDQYFNGVRQQFDVPLTYIGSDFRHQVWSALQNISFGQTITYQDVADSLGRPSAVRAVASAVGANPLSIFIPCHRVIGKNGSLTGYAGGLSAKQHLLELESDSGHHKV